MLNNSNLISTTTLYTTITSSSFTTVTSNTEKSFASLDFHSILALFFTILLIGSASIIRLYYSRPPKSTLAYFHEIFGNRSYSIILNFVFLSIGFIAFWSAIRRLGLNLIDILQFTWSVPNLILDLMGTIGLALIAFLSLTIVGLIKEMFDTDGSRSIQPQRLVSTAIIAVLIALLQVSPQITDPDLYYHWINAPNSTYLLITITSVMVASIAILSFLYYHLPEKSQNP